MSAKLYAAEEVSAFGLTNFAFASYLGTGFYSTSGQEVFVLQIPLEHTITAMTDTEPGLTLTLPLTVGFINFTNIDIDNLPEFEDVATVTFLPGLKYHIPVLKNWTLIPFIDYGFARDLNNTTNVLMTGAGIRSYYDYRTDKATLTLGNRFLYARERSDTTQNNSDYSLIETGLNYRIKSQHELNGKSLYTNMYYINYYYPDNLVFLERTQNPIKVGVENEIGFTFSNLPDFWLFKDPQLGFGIRTGNDIDVYRIIFGAPF